MPDGKLYLLGSTYGALVIQPLSNPYTIGGPQTEIAHRDQSWEQVVIEAPGAVWHNGQLTLLYSAGGYNKDNYGVGGLKLTGGDPTRAASWTKLPGPLFRGLPSAHVWCAGVASPFPAPDGRETWFVYSDYNAYDYAKDFGAGPRTIMAQPLTWNADNTPDLGVPIAPGRPLPLPSGEAAGKKAGH
jgi:GH43 family beta-xylosidase